MIAAIYGHKTNYQSDDNLRRTLKVGRGRYRSSHFVFSTDQWDGLDFQGLGFERAIYGVCIWGHCTMSDPDSLLGETYGL